MPLFLKCNTTGNIAEVNVESEDSIYCMLALVESMTNIEQEELQLLWWGTRLQGRFTLGDYGIQDGSVIHVSKVMKVVIKNLEDWSSMIFVVACSSSMSDVMELIQRRTGFSEEDQRLIFWRTVLDPKRTLLDYGVQHGNVIHLTVKTKRYPLGA